MEPEEIKDLTPQIQENNELNAAAEFKGNKEDEEDLLLTAQRYLNIFHQIHIFKEFRKKQFDEELMNIPQEIRKVIALLPGGRILLEHIAELLQEANKHDPALDSLLASLADHDHYSDTKISIEHQPNQMLESSVTVPTIAPQVVNAPIELSDNFTKTLADSFKAYSHNLEALTENIQKMVLKVPTSAPASDAIGSEVATALTSSFNAYSENLKELTESIQKLVVNQPATTTATPSIEISSEFTKALTDSFGTYSHNLEALTASIQQLAQNRPAAANSATPTSIEIGSEFAKVLTDSFGNFAHNLEELTVSVQKIATAQSPQPLEISDKFASVLNDSLTTYSQNLQDLKTSIQLIASAAPTQKAAKQNETSIPNFADSIATILKENAQQQMNILKSFGETLSKTIADSQKELITSLKSSQKNSMIIGKFMQVPSEDAVAMQEPEHVVSKDSDTAANNQKSAFSTVQLLSSSAAENVNQNSTASAEKSNGSSPLKAPKDHKNQPAQAANDKKSSAKKADDVAAKQQPTNSSATDKKQKSNINPEPAKPTTPQAKTNQNKSAQKTSDKPITLSAPTSPTNSAEEVDINDIFAQMSASLTGDDPLTPLDTDSDDTLADAFTTANSQTVEQPETPQKEYEDAVSQIQNALNTDNPISLDDIDDEPVSLSPDNNDISNAFIDTPLEAETEVETQTPAADDIAEAWSDEVADDNHSDENEWEYEYVDEDGNPITPSADDEWEYEYVDEDGSDGAEQPEEEWEYEYVDEQGNPISPSDDNEWEYVDEDGNPINS